MTTAFMIRPRLDGFLDWLRKKKPASGMIPAEPRKESKFAAFRKEPEPEERPSKFDKFRTEEEIAERALIERPIHPVVPEPPRSEFAMFAPEAPTQVPAAFQEFAPKPPAPEGIPAGFEMFAPEAPAQVPAAFQEFAPKLPSTVVPKEFELFIPTPEERALAEETHEEKELRQMELWKDLFTPQTEEKDVFGEFAPTPQELVVAEEVKHDLYPFIHFDPYDESETVPVSEVADDWDIDEDKLSVLPLPPREVLIPDAEEVARAIVTMWGEDTIYGLWNEIRDLYGDPDWVQSVEKYADASMGDQDLYDVVLPKHHITNLSTVESAQRNGISIFETAAFFGIPREEIKDLGEYEEYKDPKYGITGEFLNSEAVSELEYALQVLFSDAMEMLKPIDIPGTVILEYDGDWDGSLCVSYIDVGDRLMKARRERFADVTEEDPIEEEGEAIEEYVAPKAKTKKPKAKKTKKPKKKSKK
jgi:hypothetical protein